MMNPIWSYVGARLAEPSSWLGIAAFFSSVGASLLTAGHTEAAGIVTALGLGFGGVGAFLTQEGKRPPSP